MGVFKALDLVPQKVDLRRAVGAHFQDGGRAVHAPAALEDRYQKFLGGKVGKGLSLPGGVRIEELQGLAFLHDLVVQRDQIREGLAGIVFKQTVNLFEMGIGDLGRILADLDLGNDVARAVLYSGQLVDPAEHRLALGGDEPLAHAEGVDPGALEQQVADDILIQRVGSHDLAFGQSRRVQHLSGLPGQVGQVAGVQPDGAAGDALGQQHLLKGADGVGNAGFEHVVGVHQQGGGVGIQLAVGLECGILVREHLYPGVGHGTAGRRTIDLVGQGAGSTGAPGNVGGPRAQNRGVGPLRPPGAEFADRAPAGGADDAVGLRGDEGLMIQREQEKGLDELGLDGRRPDGEEGLAGENGGTLRHRPNIAGEAEGLQIL